MDLANHTISRYCVLHFEKKLLDSLGPHTHEVIQYTLSSAIIFQPLCWVLYLLNTRQYRRVAYPLVLIVRLKAYLWRRHLILLLTGCQILAVRNWGRRTRTGGVCSLRGGQHRRLGSEAAATHAEPLSKLRIVPLEILRVMSVFLDHFLFLHWRDRLLDHLVDWCQYRREQIPGVHNTVPHMTSYASKDKIKFEKLKWKYLLMDNFICSDLSRNGSRYVSACSFQNISISYFCGINYYCIFSSSYFFLRLVFFRS